jgi:hypothetical protein
LPFVKCKRSEDVGRFGRVVGWNCLPLAQALSIEVAATSVVDRLATTRRHVMDSRPFIYGAPFQVSPQGLIRASVTNTFSGKA